MEVNKDELTPEPKTAPHEGSQDGEPQQKEAPLLAPTLQSAPLSAEATGPRRTEPALEALFQDHYRLIYATAYRVTGSGADAEDVLQTVFLRLAARGNRLDLSERPGAYLHRAAVNGALDLLRSRSRAKAVPLGPANELDLTALEPSPEAHARASDLRDGLRLAVAELSEKSAEVFALRYFAEKNNKEIAESLGVTQTAVGVMLHRARKSVKDRMQSFLGDN